MISIIKNFFINNLDNFVILVKETKKIISQSSNDAWNTEVNLPDYRTLRGLSLSLSVFFSDANFSVT